MIFVTVGSQRFQFDRLLKELDKLVKEKKINDELYAQTGYSNHKPENYNYKSFLDRDEFKEVMLKCDKVITHGGTGAIMGALKQGKKVIAVARLKEFGEHVDNHQLQIIEEFHKMNFIRAVDNIEELSDVLNEIENIKLCQYISNTEKVIESIERYIKGRFLNE